MGRTTHESLHATVKAPSNLQKRMMAAIIMYNVNRMPMVDSSSAIIAQSNIILFIIANLYMYLPFQKFNTADLDRTPENLEQVYLFIRFV